MTEVYNSSGQSGRTVSRLTCHAVLGVRPGWGAVASSFRTCFLSVTHERSMKKKGSKYINLWIGLSQYGVTLAVPDWLSLSHMAISPQSGGVMVSKLD